MSLFLANCGLLARAPGGGGGITFVGAGSFQASGSAVSPGLPAGTQQDDLLLLLGFSASFQTAMTVSGYTQAPNSPQTENAFAFRQCAFWKRAGSSESAPTTSDTGDMNIAQILGFRGVVASGSPFDVSQGSIDLNNNTSVIIPGVTTTVANAFVVPIVGFSNAGNSTANVSGGANADLDDFAELTDNSSSLFLSGGFVAFGGIKAVAGVVGNTTGTLAAACSKAYLTYALIPA